ncbi:hypothetical protein G6F68_019723 [Rhizopus microsporus]|nr:hypothetical protein G6F68_019723 [Rhizopus microsporus]
MLAGQCQRAGGILCGLRFKPLAGQAALQGAQVQLVVVDQQAQGGVVKAHGVSSRGASGRRTPTRRPAPWAGRSHISPSRRSMVAWDRARPTPMPSLLLLPNSLPGSTAARASKPWP